VAKAKTDLTGLYYTKIVKSLKYLEYSYNRTLKMPTNPATMTDPEFEAWDSFAARFARSSDIFLSKFIRAYILRDDPAFDGGFRDQVGRAEKLGLLYDVNVWMEIRELRNAIVHEYSDQDLDQIFQKFRKFTPLILDLRSKLSHASDI